MNATVKTEHFHTAQETSIVGPKSDNTSTPSIYHGATEMVSMPECFDVEELINDLVKDSKSTSPEKSEAAKQQNESQSETDDAKNQHENELPEENSNHGNESQKDVYDKNQSVDKTTDDALTKETISLLVRNIVSLVDKVFANKF